MPLDQDDPAPDLALPSAPSGSVSLRDLRGRAVVVYFYPKDDTSGCTIEAHEFSALKADFDAAGATVIGVSPDTLASHEKFRGKHDLAIELASDPDTQVLQAWGVWVEKSMYGRKYMGVERTTFLVGRDGRINRIWRKVKPAGHAAAVLAAVRELA